jgi:hypothetical protein
VTICISLKVPDGLVLAADSMSSYTVLNPATQGWDVVQSYSFANKVIQFGKAPIGALVWGLGSLQARSMQNLIEEYVNQYFVPGQKPAVAAVASSLSGFMRAFYEHEYPDALKRPTLGFLVGGYDSSSPFARLWGFEFPTTPNPQEVLENVQGKPVFGVKWFGMTDALVRLINGFDLRLVQGLKNKGFDAQAVDDFFSFQNLAANNLAYQIIFDGMPLQDAIDFAAYLVHVVKGRFRFVVGPKVCGGPVDIAVLKPGSFDWVRRKTLSHEHEI